MDKPKKKVFNPKYSFEYLQLNPMKRKRNIEGYNQACDKYEEFLPSLEELLEMIRDIGAPGGLPLSMSQDIAKAISKRIGNTT